MMMRGVVRQAVVGAVGLVLSLVALPAAADPATVNSIQLGVGFRYGFELEPGELNPWGTGLGLDGGITLPNAVYVGGNFEYFFGESLQVSDIEYSGNLWQLTAEGGYDIGLGPILVLRPKVGLGVAGVSSETCDASLCTDDSSTDFVLAPGGTFILMPPGFSLSLDVRYDMIFAERTLNGVIVSAGIGF